MYTGNMWIEVFVITSLLSTLSRSASLPMSNQQQQQFEEQQYLTQFGYLPQTDGNIGHLMSREVLEDALRELQRYAHIPATGTLDAATQQLMATPRCGLPDRTTDGTRTKRFVLTDPWTKSELTWRVQSSAEQLDMASVREDVARAFALWSSTTALRFTEVHDYNADIVINFFRGDHAERGDGGDSAFDGPGKVLAHAFFPGSGIGGDAHFDLDEKWKTSKDNRRDGTNLFAVAVHEFGHSLGLRHSNDPNAIMYAYLVQSDWDTLPYDDNAGIQQLYPMPRKNPDSPEAPRRARPWMPDFSTLPWVTTERTPQDTPRMPWRTTDSPRRPADLPRRPADSPRRPADSPRQPTDSPRRRPNPSSPRLPDICTTSPDAIATISNELFVFKGAYMWRFSDPKDYRKVEPVTTSRMFVGLPDEPVDAVYQSTKGLITFFIGRNCYEIRVTQLGLRATSRPLTYLGLPSTLNKVNAAVVYLGQTYLVGDNRHWILDEDTRRVEVDHDRREVDRQWCGMVVGVEAAFQWPPRAGASDAELWYYQGGYARRYDTANKYAGPFQPLPFCSAASRGRETAIILVVLLLLLYYLLS